MYINIIGEIMQDYLITLSQETGHAIDNRNDIVIYEGKRIFF